MASFELGRIASQLERSGGPYLEFLRVRSLSMGLYRLSAGAEDGQRPHGEDEVYYALSGRARLRVENDDHAVEPGSILFVGARADHRFHHITDDLTLLVFFAPAEGSAAATGAP